MSICHERLNSYYVVFLNSDQSRATSAAEGTSSAELQPPNEQPNPKPSPSEETFRLYGPHGPKVKNVKRKLDESGKFGTVDFHFNELRVTEKFVFRSRFSSYKNDKKIIMKVYENSFFTAGNSLKSSHFALSIPICVTFS